MARTWSDTAYERPTPPVGWRKNQPWSTWVLLKVERPYGHSGPRRWCFELQSPAYDEYSAEWFKSLGSVA